MFFQIALGTGFMLLTIILSALAFWGLEAILIRARPWLARPPYRPKLMGVLSVAVLWSFSTVTAGVWIWAMAFWGLGVFVTIEASVYFSLVAFTTLGFGDILLPQQWRLLAGMSAANGLLIFGLLTAMLVEVLRFARLQQEEEDEPDEPDRAIPKVQRPRRTQGFFTGGRR